MTPKEFSVIALAIPGAVESSHMNHPDFRVGGKIFATIAPDGKRGMVKLTPEQQAEAMRDSPSVCEPASGAWGRKGCTMLTLENADEDLAAELLEQAFRNTKK